MADHPELRGERYQEAEDYWEFDFPDRALPVYEDVLAAHEAVLPADDTATLQLRQRVAEAYPAVGRPVTALALLTQTQAQAHLGRVLGPRHPDTRRAIDDMTNARSQLGLSRDEARALAAEPAELERTLGSDHPKALRTACALSSALQPAGQRGHPRRGPLNNSAACIRTDSRRRRPAGVSPPPSAYLTHQEIQPTARHHQGLRGGSP